jgi:hypothetical protein
VIDPSSSVTEDSEDIKVDFITDATVLDMDGGKKLSGKGNLTAPRDMLLMELNGKDIKFVLRDELDDISEVNRVTTKPETPTVPDRRGAPPRGGGDIRTLLRGG